MLQQGKKSVVFKPHVREGGGGGGGGFFLQFFP